MKKIFKLFTITFALMFVCLIKVNAAEITVGNALELKNCVAASNVCKLTNDINMTETIEIINGQDVTITLGEGTTSFNITGATTLTRMFKISNGSLIIKGKGKITGYGRVFSVLGNLVTGQPAKKAKLEIGKDVEAYAKDVSETSKTAEEVVLIAGDGSVLDLYGLVSTDSSESSPKSRAAIEGIGTITGEDCRYTKINIYDGAKVLAPNNHAIYHPQYGDLTIYGGTITGITGVEMRAGKLVVKGGTITGTANSTVSTSNDGGSTTNGVGIAAVQHTTGLDLSVEITGGTIKGHTALYHNNTQNNNATEVNKVNLKIKNGNFETINGGTNAIFSDTKENFIEGGKFKGTVEDKFIDSSVEMKEVNGVTFVGTSIPIDNTNNTTTVKNPNTGDSIATFLVIGFVSLIAGGFAINKLRRNA